MERESFIVYRGFYKIIKILPEEEQLKVFKAMFEYGLDGVEPHFTNEGTDAVWSAIFPQLKANTTRYLNACNAKKKTSGQGKKEGNGKVVKANVVANVEPKPIANTVAKGGANENDNENDNENVNVFSRTTSARARERERMNIPTAEEVASYVEREKLSVDPKRFFDFYTSNGWMVGKHPVADWKALLRLWAMGNPQTDGNSERNGKAKKEEFMTHKYTEEELKSVLFNFDDWTGE